jgi:hypothetical protein
MPFVRFRQQIHRLQASLIHNRRVDGKVQSQHIGTLGSVDTEVSVRARVAFWAQLPDRLDALSNRLSEDEHPKIIAALDHRIPIVTTEDIRSVQDESFEGDERFWGTLEDLNARDIENHKALIALAEAKIAATEQARAKAAEEAEAARSKRERLKRGESVRGGLGKPLGYDDMVAILKAAGFTPRDFRRLEMAGSLTKAEFATWLEYIPAQLDAAERASDRELRRIVRARERTKLMADLRGWLESVNLAGAPPGHVEKLHAYLGELPPESWAGALDRLVDGVGGPDTLAPEPREPGLPDLKAQAGVHK